MALEKTWRWFGAGDSVSLADIRQMGVEGVVTALYDVPPGEVWPIAEIRKVKAEIERHGMNWSVVESLPVAEGVKTRSSNCSRLVENYRQSLYHLGVCGIDTVCYNFMPVLDWARTDLHFVNEQGGESMLFDYPAFAAFDIYVLQRPNAAKDYDAVTQAKARDKYATFTSEQAETLAHNIIIVTQAFLNGAVDSNAADYKRQFLDSLLACQVDSAQLRNNLAAFLYDIIPVAEECGVNMCIHPDDPPFPLLGLPRIASTLDDLLWIVNCYPSPANGITLCTGSLSVRDGNDIVDITRKLASRIHFVHLRNTCMIDERSFYESGHLNGNVDMYAVVRTLLEEQALRKKQGRRDFRMPFRPDHGVRILDDFEREANPGYPLYGRMKGLAEIDGMQRAVERAMKNY